MTFNEEDLEPLKAALLTGATSMTIDGRAVTFRSLQELKETIQMVQDSIHREANPESSGAPSNVRATFSKY